jgi:hypothetical protein
MKRLAILSFVLGVCVTPALAQDQKPVTFNGMVFDAPPPQGAEAPKATTKPKASHQVKKHTHHKGSAT